MGALFLEASRGFVSLAPGDFFEFVHIFVATILRRMHYLNMFNSDEFESEGRREGLSRAQTSLIGAVLVVAVGSVMYRVLMGNGLGHSAALFVGIPAVLAIMLAATPKSKTALGAIMKGITLMLLVVATLVGEGWLCILVASPLFYLVGLAIGLAVDWSRKRGAGKGSTLSCVAVVMLPMCLEGVVPAMTFGRMETVEATRVVAAPAAEVERSLAGSPDLRVALPAAIGAGFPHPMAAWGGGLRVGDERVVHFSGAEGDPEGDLRMRVAAAGEGYVRTDAVSDSSKLTQWVRWQSNDVTWRAVDAGRTEVVWRITFERQLDPAWYFAPLERGAVREAAKWMIDSNATPMDARQR
jgi:hypothetical protein